MNVEWAMIGDAMVPLAEAQIPVNDRGLYFGDGVYEVLRCCQGRLFALAEHLDRLRYSLDAIGLNDRVDVGQFHGRIQRLVAKSGLSEAIVYAQVTRGAAPRALEFDDDLEPTCLLTIRPTPPRTKTTYRAITHPDLRWQRCDIKSLNLLPNVLARQAARHAGADDAILVDADGYVTESTSSSVMLIAGGVLRTAPLTANILAGVTRSFLLKWAPELGLTVREESFTVEQALAADELFLCGTTTEVMPIVRLDDTVVSFTPEKSKALQLHRRLLDRMNQGC